MTRENNAKLHSRSCFPGGRKALPYEEQYEGLRRGGVYPRPVLNATWDKMIECLIVALFLVIGASASVGAEQPRPESAPAPNPVIQVNPMHPAFKFLDAKGDVIKPGGKGLDQIRTCGQCHATDFIQKHDLTAHQQRNIECVACHYQGGKVDLGKDAFEADGTLKREFIRIAKPAISNCAACHGLAGASGDPAFIPDDYRNAAYPRGEKDQSVYQLTRGAGSIYSSQDIDASFLNISGKQTLTFPWDVHAKKMLRCSDCHFAPNNPQRISGQTGETAGLRGEPRRKNMSEYLKEPDHKLFSANCRTCHDPERGHAFLPYHERHFQVLACESCHIPRMHGPAEQTVDATLLDESGSPIVDYRGVKGKVSNLNTAYVEGFDPPLVGMDVALPINPATGFGEKNEAGGKPPQKAAETPAGPAMASVMTPINAVTSWYWASSDSNQPVAREVLQRALLTGGHFRPELIAALDTNHDGRLDRSELKLNTDAKRITVERLLKAAGVQNPVIRSEVGVHKISHGVAPKDKALSDCMACHGQDSRLSGDIVLASSAPGGIRPDWKEKTGQPGRIEMESSGPLVLKPESAISKSLYVPGLRSQTWPDKLGLLILMGTVLSVGLHGGLRLLKRRRNSSGELQHAPAEKQYLFTSYERIWHWVMALSVLALILTGIRVHFPDRVHLFNFSSAVDIHNYFAAVLVINAFLALFHHVTTAAIRQFLPRRKGIAEELKQQGRYYLFGIFSGGRPPFQPSPERKLNVLQQITYLGLLNVLFPFQTITGVLIWLVGKSPAFASAVGGLNVIAPLHNFGSWMFITFLVAHVYLTTTGHTILAHLRGMIDGYEDGGMGRPATILKPTSHFEKS